MHHAGTFVNAAQGVVHARAGNQLALRRLWAECIAGNGDHAAQRNAMLVLKN